MSYGNGGFHSRAEHSNPAKTNQLWDKIKDDSGQRSKEGDIIVLRLFAIYTVALPPLKNYHNGFQQAYKDAIIDRDMKADLEQADVINWCRTAKKLYPLKTTGDGNCLLHAVSQYLWGVEDSNMYLRRIMYINITQDPKGTFKRRWLTKQRLNEARLQILDRINTEAYTMEWETVIQGTVDMAQNGPSAAPYTCLESIHLYILANMLKRPIILLADTAARSVFGQSLQDNDLSGIYLPLDIPANECSKVPVILGYNLSHFAPLLSEEDSLSDSQGRVRELAIPLVRKDCEFLPVQYLLPDEERQAQQLLGKYLQLKELVYSQRNNIMTVPSVEVTHLPLQPEFNLMHDFLKDCEVKYHLLTNQNPLLYPLNTAPVQESIEPVYQPLNPQPVRIGQQPTHHPKAAPPRTRISDGEQYQKLQQQQRQCIVVGCNHYGTPEYSNMCFSCFKDFTVQFHKQELQARKHQQQRHPANGSQYHDLSMMGEDCKAGCGFKCSTETYPFCHECQPKFEARHQSLKVGQELQPNSLMPEKCYNPDCDNFCSAATYPYCHVCFNLTQKIAAKPPTAPPPSFPQGAAQGPGSMEETQVVQIGANHLPVTKRPINPMMPRTLGLQTQMQQSPIGQLDRKCSQPSCSNFAVIGNNGKCETCYSESLFGAGTSPTTAAKVCITPHCGKPVIWNTDKCRKCFVDDGTNPRENDPRRRQLPLNIAPPGDEKILNSVPEATVPIQYFQAGPTVRPQPQQHDEKSALSKYICTKPGCQGQRTTDTEPYCYSCWNQMMQAGHQVPQPGSDTQLEVSCTPVVFSEAELRKLNPLVVSSRQKVKCASQYCETMIYPPKQLCDKCTDILANAQATISYKKSISEGEGTNQCRTPGCKFYGSSEFSGFCSRCFTFPKTEDIRRHTAPLASNRPEVAPAKHSTAPIAAKPAGKPCIEVNCPRFGDPTQGERCSLHYREAMEKMPKSPKSDYQHRVYPGQTQPAPANISAPVTQNVPQPQDNYISGLHKLESSWRSNKLCTNHPITGCPNYGNSKKKGYCNTCYPQVQRSERI